MTRKRRTLGEYIDLAWDGDGEPQGYYVAGHVSEDEFRAAIAVHFGDRLVVPPDARIDHVYTHSVRVENDWHGNRVYETRHRSKSPGSRATYWEIEPNRGGGA